MTEPVTAVVDEDLEIVEWFDGESRHVGSRYGSAYVDFCNRWLSAERTHKAEQSAKADAAEAPAPTPVTEVGVEPGVVSGVEGSSDVAPPAESDIAPPAESTAAEVTEDAKPQTSRRRR